MGNEAHSYRYIAPIHEGRELLPRYSCPYLRYRISYLTWPVSTLPIGTYLTYSTAGLGSESREDREREVCDGLTGPDRTTDP